MKNVLRPASGLYKHVVKSDEGIGLASVEVKSRVWTLGELRDAHRGDIVVAETGGFPIRNHQSILQNFAPLHVEFGTTQPKKIDEFREPLLAQTKDISLASAVRSLGWWLCDPEESGTFAGNAAGKALRLIDRIYNHHSNGYDRYVREQKRRGRDPSAIIYALNDTGYSFQHDYRHELEFLKSAHKAGPVSWPGPELGPVIDAHTGVVGFFGDLKRMAARREQEGKDTNLKGFDEVTYMFFQPKPRMEDIRVYSFSARVPVQFLLNPEAYAGEVLTSLHFMKLRGENVPDALKEVSIAQIKKPYLRDHSPMAYALREFFASVDVPRAIQANFFSVAKQSSQKFVVATQDNYSDYAVPESKPLLLGKGENIAVSRAHYNRLEDGSLMRMSAENDALVLHDNTKPRTNADVLAMMDLLYTAIVDRQVCVEEASGKPLIILQKRDDSFYTNGFSSGDLNWDDPKVERAFLKHLDAIDIKEKPWQNAVMLMRYLHEKNFIKQEEHHLYTQIDPAAPDAAQQISNKIREGLSDRMESPDYAREVFGKDRRGRFEVFIAGSAGTHAQDYIDQAEKLAYWAASEGHPVRTGGGNFGVMGGAARGVMRFIKEHPDRAHETHLSLIQTFRTIQFEGAAVDPAHIKKMPNVHMAIEKTFDARMESLFRVSGSDARDPTIGTANVLMAGGVGTVQEATRWMRFKESGVPHMQGKKMIFFNQPQAGDVKGERIGVLDAVIHSYPKEIRDAHIDARTTLEGVKQAITAQHAEWSQKYGRSMRRGNDQRPALQL